MSLYEKARCMILKTEIGKKIISNQHYRIITAAAISFVINILYALYNGILGIINLSLWFFTMFAFYSVFACMRFFAVICAKKYKSEASDDSEYFVMRLSGIFLIILSFILIAIIYISQRYNIAPKHDEVIMITIASYTFTKIIITVIKAVKQHNNPSVLFFVVRCVSYAEVAVSVLTLQRSMLASFGEMRYEKITLMNAIIGASVCLFVLLLGFYMIINSLRKDKNYGKIKTCKDK